MQTNNTIRMVFVDLDGTLLNGVRTVTKRTQQAFARVREAGIIPVICTGRLAYESDFAAEAIGANGYLIACNGADVYLNYAKHKRIYQTYLELDIARQIIGVLRDAEVFFEAYTADRAYAEQACAERITCCWDAEHAEFFQSRMTVVLELDTFLARTGLRPNKFFAGMPRPEQMQTLREKLGQIPGVVTYASGERLLEILPENVDKRRGVRAIMAVEGLTREQIMVIGDSENDVGMFEEANICVAMENACAQLKAKANYYAPSNREDGVVWALENLLLAERSEPFHGQIESLSGEQIAQAMASSTRQYFAGDLKLPQTLPFLFDANVECGISAYPNYKWEAAHYHTNANEYCYMLAGETKYINLMCNTEYTFRAGDFYILHRDTPYLQKCQKGCRLLFFKVPGMNDKVLVPMTDQMKNWCARWETVWDDRNKS